MVAEAKVCPRGGVARDHPPLGLDLAAGAMLSGMSVPETALG